MSTQIHSRFCGFFFCLVVLIGRGRTRSTSSTSSGSEEGILTEYGLYYMNTCQISMSRVVDKYITTRSFSSFPSYSWSFQWLGTFLHGSHLFSWSPLSSPTDSPLIVRPVLTFRKGVLQRLPGTTSQRLWWRRYQYCHCAVASTRWHVSYTVPEHWHHLAIPLVELDVWLSRRW